ncbi:hypothetical protein CUZ56_01867 [Saezia sanguinis]|uniref:Uncharacterized protein n=1 Tax=Saezia sanguinis TaxID=1965230 RepID=A0A433SCW2_9BURK|nr:hypothetical protein [Saezia sanguinis]RUS66587.1 hypothetical protein CUZ56_01867 [Saezia sanguinis]
MGADFSQIAPQAGGTLVSGAMQAYGALSQGRSAREAGRANARILEEQANNRLRASTVRGDVLRSQARQVIGEQLAAGAQSGVGLSGSRLDMLRQSYDNLEADVAAVHTDAQIDATGLRNQATVQRWEGDQAYKAGKMGALTAAVNTGVSLYSLFDSVKPVKDQFKKNSAQSAGSKTSKYPAMTKQSGRFTSMDTLTQWAFGTDGIKKGGSATSQLLKTPAYGSQRLSKGYRGYQRGTGGA